MRRIRLLRAAMSKEAIRHRRRGGMSTPRTSPTSILAKGELVYKNMTTTGLAPLEPASAPSHGTLLARKSDRPSAGSDEEKGCTVGSAAQTDSSPAGDRRRHQRLDLHLPVEFRQHRPDGEYVLRTITRNVGTGGLYFELDSADFQPGDRLDVELTLPPAEGVSPYPGRAATEAEILRIDPIHEKDTPAIRRYGLAARFLEPLRFSY